MKRATVSSSLLVLFAMFAWRSPPNGHQGRSGYDGEKGRRLHQGTRAGQGPSGDQQHDRRFNDHDLCVVFGLDGKVLAHGANSALIGATRSAKDADGNSSGSASAYSSSRASGRTTSS